MAQKRMFSKTITNSSKFLMMPQSTQNLYFHIGMNADDDGFCEHFVVMRMTESKPDDLKILQAKGLVHVFDDRVLIVSDWKENNYIRNDRYSPSKYLKEYEKELKLLSNNVVGIPNDNQRLPQVRLDKVRLDKDRQVSPTKNDLFDQFWSIYPKKVGKVVAISTFKKIKPDKSLLKEIIEGVKKYKQTDQWKKDNGAYIPNPSTFLNQRRWEDEIKTKKKNFDITSN